ncbi:AHH domain-containing protein [Teredinibacter sp. KSP-S5-2]|uniref:AHH domain-containing protein n=1 Tax=Teredinibacter sp. KSP-S5-2 TaxID=3034506 RepID=UPI0029351E81|nr:AHH domain-containing protein [Teredinibacter sp. KSP-S5-2]WNO08428.1 AHH domain-containing protein [Teredinibacter sp. KSP-S5-2]
MASVQELLREYGKSKYNKDNNKPYLSDEEFLEKLGTKVKDWSDDENKKQKKNSPSEDKKGNEEHTPFTGKLTAVLWKDKYYAERVKDGLEDRGGEGNVFAVEKSFIEKAYGEEYPNLIDVFTKYYSYGAVKCNFNHKAKYTGEEEKVEGDSKSGYVKKRQRSKAGKQARCSMPYKWNAHHMIPGSAFYSEYIVNGSFEEVFTQEQYYLLLMSDYNVNNKRNMIPLPAAKMEFFQPVHKMLRHPSNHPRYTKHVQRRLEVISKQIKNIRGDLKKPHPNVSVKLAKQMTGIEDDCWELLHSLGEEYITAYVEGRDAGIDKNYTGLSEKSSCKLK